MSIASIATALASQITASTDFQAQIAVLASVNKTEDSVLQLFESQASSGVDTYA